MKIKDISILIKANHNYENCYFIFGTSHVFSGYSLFTNFTKNLLDRVDFFIPAGSIGGNIEDKGIYFMNSSGFGVNVTCISGTITYPSLLFQLNEFNFLTDEINIFVDLADTFNEFIDTHFSILKTNIFGEIVYKKDFHIIDFVIPDEQNPNSHGIKIKLPEPILIDSNTTILHYKPGNLKFNNVTWNFNILELIKIKNCGKTE